MPQQSPTSPVSPTEAEDLQDALFDLDEQEQESPAEEPSEEGPSTSEDDPSTGSGSVESASSGDVESASSGDVNEDPSTGSRDMERADSGDAGERLHLDYRIASDVGRIRKNNQDSGCASPTMLLVADGMGGAAAGDLASTVAVSTAVAGDGFVEGEQMLDALGDIVRRANNRIADLVADDHSLEGMGTTVSGGLFDGHHFGVCHIGDSRIYLIRDGEMEPLTHDHSWVQSLIDEGNLTEEDAATHPHRSLLLKVLNGHPTNVPDTAYVELRAGDRLVLCSDGLCGFVSDEAIQRRASGDSLDESCESLVEAALDAGGLDNITVILAEVVERAPDPPLEPTSVGAVTTIEVPEIAPRSIDLGDDEDDPDESDAPVRPSAPEPSEPADEEDLRYAISPTPRRRWLRTLIITLLALVVMAGGCTAAVAWGRTQYYVGVADDKVAIYQGLPQNVLGLPLSTVYEVQDIDLADLPPYRRQQLTETIRSASLNDAHNTVAELRKIAEDCRESKEGPGSGSDEECT